MSSPEISSPSPKIRRFKLVSRLPPVEANTPAAEPVEVPDIPDHLLIHEVAEQYPPGGWEEEFQAKKAEILISSKLIIANSKGVAYAPANRDIFRAFHLTPKHAVRVVIIGQDPYPGEGVAMGLAFSTRPGEKIPASLKNIFLELMDCIPGYQMPTDGNLEHWARQGVFLINSCLTCPIGNANGHSKYNIWIPFISYILKAINNHNKDCYYLLWGKTAQDCEKYIKAKPDRILKAPHPSPLSAHRGFFGCQHFKIVNSTLVPPINW